MLQAALQSVADSALPFSDGGSTRVLFTVKYIYDTIPARWVISLPKTWRRTSLTSRPLQEPTTWLSKSSNNPFHFRFFAFLQSLSVSLLLPHVTILLSRVPFYAPPRILSLPLLSRLLPNLFPEQAALVRHAAGYAAVCRCLQCYNYDMRICNKNLKRK